MATQDLVVRRAPGSSGPGGSYDLKIECGGRIQGFKNGHTGSHWQNSLPRPESSLRASKKLSSIQTGL
ncbi:hypothetical protein PENANT_c025G09490 [Penicillium antarcticum]|uniref:Uncharacterized protein n=1 Tax=Penicillium antarcticum TaxID=416450 RepID=A0A1V6PXN7_9EURO|nr:hypothetical protein PENANT_c025G09490 [Penicillium antarcticum]